MRKKTEPQTPKHPKTSRTEAGKKGLIAKEENLLRSARETCALDDHSHRTKKHKAQRAHSPVLPMRKSLPCPLSPSCAGWAAQYGRSS
jgi:hypothetical protein